MQKRLMCVWLPNWPVQRVQAEQPQLANLPLILSARDARRGMIVAAANLQARSHGVRPAMRLSEATALVEAETIEHDPHEDIEALCSLAEQAQQFSPIVGLEQLDKSSWTGRTLQQPECILLDITGLGHLFGSEQGLAEQVARWLSQQRYFGCMGIADTVGGAWAIANYASRGAPPRPLPNKMQDEAEASASTVTDNPGENDDATNDDSENDDDEKSIAVPPCRIEVVAPGTTSETISRLPVAALRIPTETTVILQRLGIRVIGQLAHLPRGGMASRLGDHLISRWDQARGQQDEPVVSLHTHPDWCLEQTLEYPTQNRETVIELVQRLSDELSKRLARRGEGALRIVCRLDLSASQPLILQVGLFRPTNQAEHLRTLIVGQLEHHLKSFGRSELWRISLQATLTSKMTWRQSDLFDNDSANTRNQMAHLVDILSSRLGRKQVLSAKVQRDAQPEQAFTMQPMTGRRSDGKEQDTLKKLSSRLAHGKAEPSRDDPLRRPTQLLSTPEPIEVSIQEGNDATQAIQKPTSFVLRGKTNSVLDARGPERLESGWWKGPGIRRDYYRVESDSGSWWWIFRDLKTGKWFLHGLFD